MPIRSDADPDIEILERSGSGLYGAAWHGRQRALNREVAVKILHPDMAAATDIVDHARAFARAGEHHNIVTVYLITSVIHPESGELVDAVVMQWLEGLTLAQRLTVGALTINEARVIIRGLIDGVRHLHDNNVTHGDLHAGNVMFRHDAVKLIDINYSDSASLQMLTTQGHEQRKQQDVDALRYLCRRVLSRSEVPPDVVDSTFEAIQQAATLDELGAVADGCFQRIRSTGSSPARANGAGGDDAVAQNAEKPFRQVFTLHGIESRGEWQKGDLGTALNLQHFVHTALDYDEFSRWQLLRTAEVERVVQKFVDDYTRKRIAGESPPSIIAHSFGTYIVAKAMEQYPEIIFDRIIFCGSIVREDFPWEAFMAAGRCNAVLNEFGTLDDVAPRGQLALPDAGVSGVEGFTDTAQGRVYNRPRRQFRHSQFFYPLNFTESWVPFLAGNIPIIDGIEIPDRVNPHFARRKRLSRRALWVVIGTIALGCSGVGVLAYKHYQKPSKPPQPMVTFSYDTFCAQLLRATDRPSYDAIRSPNIGHGFEGWAATVAQVGGDPKKRQLALEVNGEPSRVVTAYIIEGDPAQAGDVITFDGTIGNGGGLSKTLAALRDCKIKHVESTAH